MVDGKAKLSTKRYKYKSIDTNMLFDIDEIENDVFEPVDKELEQTPPANISLWQQKLSELP